MKPLTIEQLKALQVGDWVWVVDLTKSKQYATYIQKDTQSNVKFNQLSWELFYSDYGIAWLAYKNKEQAETKNYEIDLHPIYGWRVQEPIYGRVYNKILFTCETKSEAERRLAELTKE